jgi:hypothetical protein
VLFFSFFRFLSLNFLFASIFSLNFRLFYLRFRFRFLVFRIEVNHVKSGFFSLPSETKFSLHFKISLPKRKRGRTLGSTIPPRISESYWEWKGSTLPKVSPGSHSKILTGHQKYPGSGKARLFLRLVYVSTRVYSQNMRIILGWTLSTC